MDAVKSGRFHIYPVKTIDEGIEILTEAKAGVKRSEGTSKDVTVNYRVNQRLREMAEKIKEFPEFIVERRIRED